MSTRQRFMDACSSGTLARLQDALDYEELQKHHGITGGLSVEKVADEPKVDPMSCFSDACDDIYEASKLIHDLGLQIRIVRDMKRICESVLAMQEEVK